MNIYVGNLPYSVTDEELKNLFQEYGEVTSAKIIINRKMNRSKGFGFVDMPSDEEAMKAIDQLHGQDYQGRKIVVNKARPRKDQTI
ncbi:MAG: RNA-binding protein [Desulfuromonas sp. SDB]|nr:MAG: RNA-binding protein [Desulfuromonas sp. SDB]